MSDEVGHDNSKGPTSTKHVESMPSAPPADVENQSSATAISSILQRWRREDLLKKGNLVLRSSAFVFSFISFIVMASNKHGDWMNFDKYEEYRYCLAIAILASLYTVLQVSREIRRISTGRDLITRQTSGYLDFFGDQVRTCGMYRGACGELCVGHGKPLTLTALVKSLNLQSCPPQGWLPLQQVSAKNSNRLDDLNRPISACTGRSI
ncbi:CASP-like protein 4B1 isoform X1 [Magnolia sinica]|uniref:CASP-like protein 4B1 isoform X1 n=1 Tax=Magnolia sinica TaxID=86752 RepID=UPI0026584DB6|nr:CASP-like protein 4B1 isoform X1 [Magnolia sinica]